mgnify:CR=1 FL=1
MNPVRKRFEEWCKEIPARAADMAVFYDDSNGGVRLGVLYEFLNTFDGFIVIKPLEHPSSAPTLVEEEQIQARLEERLAKARKVFAGYCEEIKLSEGTGCLDKPEHEDDFCGE